MKKNILLTRPRASSERFAALLAQNGFDCTIEPLLQIEPMQTQRPKGTFQAIVITSAGALDALRERNENLADLFSRPCFCVGVTTGEAAREFGFTDIRCGVGDSAELADKIVESLTDKDTPLLHISGDVVDGKAHDVLAKQGVTLTQWVVYHATAKEDLSQPTCRLFTTGGIAAVPVFSPRTARVLIGLIEKNGLISTCHNIVAVGLSQAVADVLQSLPWQRLCVAPTPTEKDVLALLQTELSMIPTESKMPPPPIYGKKKNHLLWNMLAIVVLAGAGSFFLVRCPYLYPPATTQSAQQVVALEKRIDALDARIKTLTEIPSVDNQPAVSDPVTTDAIKNLQAQIAALQNQGTQTQQSARKEIMAAIAYWDLREAAKSGHSFAIQLTALRNAVGDEPMIMAQVEKLTPLATAATPTYSQLFDDLSIEESKISLPSEDNTPNIWARVRVLFRPLISVHPLHDARFALLENALNNNAGQTARDAFKNLPDDTQNKLSAWQAKLDKRVALDDALHELDQSFAAGAPQSSTGDNP